MLIRGLQFEASDFTNGKLASDRLRNERFIVKQLGEGIAHSVSFVGRASVEGFHLYEYRVL